MSTRIYSGLLLSLPENSSTTDVDFLTEIKNFRDEAVHPLVYQRFSHFFYQSLIKLFSLITFHRQDSAKLVHALREFIDDSNPDLDVLNDSLWTLAYEHTKNAVCDAGLFKNYLKTSLIIFPEYRQDNTMPAMLFVEDSKVQDTLLNDFAFFRNYSYWNNSDKPDNVTEEEWQSRESLWHAIFKTNSFPTKVGLTIDLYSGNMPDFLNSYAPTERIFKKYSDGVESHFFEHYEKLIGDTEKVEKAIASNLVQNQLTTQLTETVNQHTLYSEMRKIVSEIKKGDHDMAIDEANQRVKKLFNGDFSFDGLRKTVFELLSVSR